MAQIWICSPNSQFSYLLTRELSDRGHWVECPGEVLPQIAELRFLLPDLIVLEGCREPGEAWDDFHRVVDENPCLPVLLLSAADADAVESALCLTGKLAPGDPTANSSRTNRFLGGGKEPPGEWFSHRAAPGLP